MRKGKCSHCLEVGKRHFNHFDDEKQNPKLLFNPILMSVFIYEWLKNVYKHIVSTISKIVENSFIFKA